MKKKLFIIFIILILISVITTGLISLNYSKNEYIVGLENTMIEHASLIAYDLYDQAVIDYNKEAVIFSEKINCRVTFIDISGVVLGDSEVLAADLENHGSRPEVISAFEGVVGNEIRYSDTLKIDLLYTAFPAEINGKTIVVRLSKPMYQIEDFNQKMLKNYIFALLAGTLIALFFGLEFGNYILSPINELIIATKRIAKGNFGEKIYIDSDDELRILAQNFNAMSEELENKMNEINAANTNLRATLDSMVNGVIAVDNERNILFINPEAESILNVFEIKSVGKKLIEVFRNHEVYDAIEIYFKQSEQQLIEKEIFYNDRYYAMTINPIYSYENESKKNGAVILIQDVTEIKSLENMRKEFVANVSHELKTPLTSIKGFVETLRNGQNLDEKTKDRFLGIIEVEASRLANLIEDLLVISRIEKGNIVNKEAIPVKETIEQVVKIMKMQGNEKDVELLAEIDISEELTILGNVSFFKQILINLVDNGIKYNKKDGKVCIKASNNEDNLVIAIEDTGIGIHEEHFDRLFERFYRVDKSRSRDVDGTGLGLSIVKHALKNLNGDIAFESILGKGTKFIIQIPLRNK